MGLAASQARLLSITARKADCEFLSMSLSHQKLALSRDMENVSNDYQKALNTTKLVYDYYSSGQSDMALTYGLLMTPSVYNDYYPKMVTDSTNRVILNSSLAAAARAAGIPAEGLLGTPSSDVRNRFIEALAGEGIISPVKAATIEAVPYGNMIGVGETVSATAATTEVTYGQLMELLKSRNDLNSMGLNTGELANIFYGGDATICEHLGNPARLGITNSSETTELTNHSDAKQQTNNIKLSDLINGDTQYYISAQSAKGELTPISGTLFIRNNLLESGSFLDWLQDAFGGLLGGIPANDVALDYAYNKVYDLLDDGVLTEYWNTTVNNSDGTCDDKSDRCEWYDEYWRNGRSPEAMNTVGTCHPDGKTNDSDYHQNLAVDSKNYIGFLYTAELDGPGFHKDRNDRSQTAINLNNLAKVFLTAFVEYQEGIQNTNYVYNVGKLSDASLYNSQTDDYKFTIVSETEVDTGDEQLYANFYDSMFNQICLNGWVENPQIDDQDYMGEMLKNGMAYISSISDDGFYYQSGYSTDRAILEVADDEAIARAEAKYNTEKAKIQSKEDTLDLKMKNLDTEISSLTTEYDTTKQLVSKTIERSIKRYDA